MSNKCVVLFYHASYQLIIFYLSNFIMHNLLSFRCSFSNSGKFSFNAANQMCSLMCSYLRYSSSHFNSSPSCLALSAFVSFSYLFEILLSSHASLKLKLSSHYLQNIMFMHVSLSIHGTIKLCISWHLHL